MPRAATLAAIWIAKLGFVCAVFFLTKQCLPIVNHAGMVALLGADVLSPSTYTHFLSAYLILMVGTALNQVVLVPRFNYQIGALLLTSLPAFSAVHESVVSSLAGTALMAYFWAIILLPFLLYGEAVVETIVRHCTSTSTSVAKLSSIRSPNAANSAVSQYQPAPRSNDAHQG